MVLFGNSPVKSEKFNTNNVLGFGGCKGTMYYYGSGASVKIGKAYYRPARSCPFAIVRDKYGKVIFNEEGISDLKNNPIFEQIIKNGELLAGCKSGKQL